MDLANGFVTTVAGYPGQSGCVDGYGLSARFHDAGGMASSSSRIYVSDAASHVIRAFSVGSGEVSTVAGLAGVSGSDDGIGDAARFYWPAGLCTQGQWLYVADAGNHTIRRVDALYSMSTYEVSTVAGLAGSAGYTDGAGASARFSDPLALTTDGTWLYVADSGNHVVRKVSLADWQVSTLAGEPGVEGYQDGTGSGAHFSRPHAVGVLAGALYVVDDNAVLRRVDPTTGAVTTVAGTAYRGYADGPAASARFDWPFAIATDGISLYVYDGGNCVIRAIEIATGQTRTIAGEPGVHGFSDGVGAAAHFPGGEGRIGQLVCDSEALYVVADTYSVRRIVLATSEVTTIAGQSELWGYQDGVGSEALFGQLWGLALHEGTLYVMDAGNCVLRTIGLATLEVSTLAGQPGVDGWSDGVGSEARFSGWTPCLCHDGVHLYVADGATVRRVVPQTGEVTTIAGLPGQMGYANGVGTEARLQASYIMTDGYSLYITEYGDPPWFGIRRIDLATQRVSLFAGDPIMFGSRDGDLLDARFCYVTAMTSDGTSLYVCDALNSTIRRIE